MKQTKLKCTKLKSCYMQHAEIGLKLGDYLSEALMNLITWITDLQQMKDVP